jgi:hypothetical protein
MNVLTILMVVALTATVAVLGLGIVSMARGGEGDLKRSVQLMFARVSLQVTAIVFVILAAFAATQA